MAEDFVASMSVAEIALVQTVQGDYALWLDGKETGMRVQLNRSRSWDRGPHTLTLCIEAGRLELRS